MYLFLSNAMILLTSFTFAKSSFTFEKNTKRPRFRNSLLIRGKGTQEKRRSDRSGALQSSSQIHMGSKCASHHTARHATPLSLKSLSHCRVHCVLLDPPPTTKQPPG